MRRGIIGLVSVLVALCLASPRMASSAPEASHAPVSKQFVPVSVSFVSDAKAWVLGTIPCGHQTCTSIARTNNRGKTWAHLPAPPAKNPQTIAFANRDDGFVLTGESPTSSSSPRHHKLFVTRNRGKHWSQVSIKGGHPVAVSTNGSQVFVIADPSRGHLKLLSGSVGGKAWRTLGTVDGEGLVAQGNYVYVYPLEVQDEVASRPALDVWNGNTLTSHTLPCTDDWANALAASTPTDLALICAGEPSAGQQLKTAYTSSSAGSGWTEVSKPPANGYVASAAATTSGTFFTGDRNGIVATRDSGSEWKTSAMRYIASGFSYVGFTDPEHGVAIIEPSGPDPILLTNDAGRHWHAVTVR